jgi:hypothetical protein
MAAVPGIWTPDTRVTRTGVWLDVDERRQTATIRVGENCRIAPGDLIVLPLPLQMVGQHRPSDEESDSERSSRASSRAPSPEPEPASASRAHSRERSLKRQLAPQHEDDLLGAPELEIPLPSAKYEPLRAPHAPPRVREPESWPPSPQYSPVSPKYSPGSPQYSPSSPKYSPEREYHPSSPRHSPERAPPSARSRPPSPEPAPAPDGSARRPAKRQRRE